jgi:cell division cycle 20-like protein 1 (cofactor of APC complex)
MARDDAAEAAAANTQIEQDIATPTLISPPESKTPPTASHKRNQIFPSNPLDRSSEPIDAAALTKALGHIEQAGRVRERTPTASPSRKRPRIYGDR